jgi:RHS repeat-associated protein
LTADHLGSPRITTDENGQVISRRDFQPFGEEIATSQRTQGLGYAGDTVRQKFTSYERDIESSLDFAQARMYNYQHGRFTAVDPLLASGDPTNPQTWNRYIYVINNPLVMIDPTGEIGDYYDSAGNWLFNDNEPDDKVYVVPVRTGANGETDYDINNRRDLGITHTEFLRRAATVYGESSSPYYPYGGRDFGELVGEMVGLAFTHQKNKIAYGANNPQAAAFRNTSNQERNGTNMSVAVFAIIESLTGGWDPSNGADAWDGAEQAEYPESDDRFRDPQKNRELHMNTMGWKISDEHYNRWKANVGSNFKAPQVKVSPGNYKGYRNKGKTRLNSVAVWGRTIFWRIQ